ncbi:MAG: Asp-tRNA(Asn)/Glu-tRNA(Gln) amidotransferase subunit GatC [Desulfobulbaceae bacterium]|nr:Asp-tRNA(Asn)/Glu-tRNA(Gln) amidotransferase subunit GatC [Desulfobulbaceae bacterium]
MNISKEEVVKVAHLARLDLSEGEVAEITEQLDRILGYVAKLNEINTENIEPTTHALALQNAFREDEVKPSLPQNESLANAPRQNGEAFVVPRII